MTKLFRHFNYIFLSFTILFGTAITPYWCYAIEEEELGADVTEVRKQASGAITNNQQCDGFGSQFQVVIAAAVYAELMNKKFVYSPFECMEHNYTQDPTFLAKKEWLINFIGHFDLNENHRVKSNATYKQFFDQHITQCAHSHTLKKIRRIFRENKNPHNYFDMDHLNIAIHIRRPNPHDNRIDGTNTPDSNFLYIINALRKNYASEKPVFHIYSQGHRDNFYAYQAPDTVLHLNESVEDTFIPMVLADVLVTSASSFSYTAALLSEGDVYYIPFWHKPLPHWKSVTDLKMT